MMDVLVTSEPDINSREVQWVDPKVWHPDRFCDPPDGFGCEYEGFLWEDPWLTCIRDQKVSECSSRFISSIEEQILNPIQVRLSDEFMNLPMGTTSLYNGHHRWFMAEKLGLIVPVVIAPERYFWEMDDNEIECVDSSGYCYD